jgi:hypothetical protein
MLGVAGALPKESPERKLLWDAAQAHLRETLPQIDSGHYEGEHWLASFAVFALSATQP